MEKLVDDLRERMLPYFRLGEEDMEYVLSADYYEWYYTYAALTRPARVLEIGVRFGYSTIAMLMGWPDVRELVLIDDGSYGVPIAESVEMIRGLAPAAEVRAFDLNTRTVNHLPAHGEFDLIHVDGDHTYYGAFHDLSLVVPLLSPTGMIVLDDVDHISRVARAARDFVAHRSDLLVTYVPTYRGHYLLHREDGPPGLRPPGGAAREAGWSGRAPASARTTSGVRSEDRQDRSGDADRRGFFKTAGRGSAAMEGIVIGGAGLTMLSASHGAQDNPGSS